jgi:hypothetical protein
MAADRPRPRSRTASNRSFSRRVEPVKFSNSAVPEIVVTLDVQGKERIVVRPGFVLWLRGQRSPRPGIGASRDPGARLGRPTLIH